MNTKFNTTNKPGLKGSFITYSLYFHCLNFDKNIPFYTTLNHFY